MTRVHVWANVTTEWSGEVEMSGEYGEAELREAVMRTLGLGVHDVDIEDYEEQEA